MKRSPRYHLEALMLPGLKRWIGTIVLGIIGIIYGVLMILGKHPMLELGSVIHDFVVDFHEVLPTRISGIVVTVLAGIFVCVAIARIMLSVLGAYLPSDRESIPDVLYRRRHLDRGPRVVVIGGGTGLSNLLRGLKRLTNNITAIVTVGDDGGSSGRLRQELGVLPPGDIRNCITALADEDRIVTELFRYRFEHGEGLEGHSFGNLFLAALSAITKNDMLEATRVASRVLNSCGQVLPATLENVALVAQMDDGSIVRGESHITEANKKIERLSCEPANPRAVPEALQAILAADLLIFGPGSLYTSIIPNMLVQGIPEAIRESKAKKIYVCNVMTQKGETTDYSVADHVEALLNHMKVPARSGFKSINAVLVNDRVPSTEARELYAATGSAPVRYDPDRLRQLTVMPVRAPLLSPTSTAHHDPQRLARVIIKWYLRRRSKKQTGKKKLVAVPGRLVPPPPPASFANPTSNTSSAAGRGE